MFSYYIISYYLVQNYILFLILRIRKTVFCAFFNIVLNSMITNETSEDKTRGNVRFSFLI